MIVYGDTQFSESLAALLRRISDCAGDADPASVDDLRALLIQAGQLEQAVADSSLSPEWRQGAERLTQSAADAFAAALCGELGRDATPQGPRSLAFFENVLAQIEQAANGTIGETRLTVRIPEGFAFYALFPEQYWRTAWTWAGRHEAERQSGARVIVVGIRSIGTTLSALVVSALSRAGWPAERLTVRPTGHPFQRQVSFARNLRADLAIVVDEGPGLSGSSMIATAGALERAGIANIHFFPGSERDPGDRASVETQRRWAHTPRWFSRLENVRWGETDLRDALAAQTQRLLGSPVVRVEDFSAGRWREFVFAGESEWPAVNPQFERAKFRCVTKSDRSLLWKFTGLGAIDSEASVFQQLERRARQGWTVAPLTTFHGFTAIPWIDGEPLTAAEVDDELLAALARYIGDTAGPALTVEEQADAVARLEFVIRENAAEALGPEFAHGISWHAPTLLDRRSFGDGRMMPHKWIRTVEGRLLKTDASAHTRDHTIVGRQSVLWDVAGTIVEWNLAETRREAFLHELARLGLEIDGEGLGFYELAYAAFRLGFVTLPVEGEAECARLERAAAGYRARLEFTPLPGPVTA